MPRDELVHTRPRARPEPSSRGAAVNQKEAVGKPSPYSAEEPIEAAEQVSASEALERRASSAELEEPAAGEDLRRVLVVDDNRDSATSLCMMLELMGSEARAAFDGMSAVETAAEFRPDIILLDIGMPGMDGYEVARRIRAQPAYEDVTLVALTGWGQEEDRRRSQEAGFDHPLLKPVDLRAVEELLSEIAAKTSQGV
jgi:CheY-like chemotaxis protein